MTADPSPAADLVSWLRVQLDEDERLAKPIAETAPWEVYDANGGREGYDPEWAISDRRNAELITFDNGARSRTLVGHIARWDPSRVLWEVEAKRRLLAEYEAEVQRGPARPAGHVAESEARHGGILDAYKAAIRMVALPFSDRSGYREEWRP